MWALSESGGVNEAEEEPKMDMSGLSRAALICIKPESLVSAMSAIDKRSVASKSVVLDARFTQRFSVISLILFAKSFSFGEPMIHTCQPLSIRPLAV